MKHHFKRVVCLGLLVSEKIKMINENRSIIDAIRHTDSTDYKSVADRVSFSWPTVKSTVDELIKEKVIEEIKSFEVKRFIPNNSFGYFLGLSIGATECKVVISSFDFEPINQNEHEKEFFKKFKRNLEVVLGKSLSKDILCFKTQSNDIEIQDMCSAIIETALNLFEKDDERDLLSVGISLPGIIDKNTGEISFCPNIPKFVAMPVSKIIRRDLFDRIKQHNISYHLCHDTVAATVYEKECLYKIDNAERSNKDKANIATIYMGYGLGCGFVFNNSLMLGASGAVGETGHIPILYSDLEIGEDLSDEQSNKELTDRSSYNWKDSSGNSYSEPNIDISLGKCACGNISCLERLIRIKVFNSNSVEDFARKTDSKLLKEFHLDHPYRYRVLKYFIAHMLCMTTNTLNVDLIVFSGRLLNEIPQLKKDMEGLLSKYSLTASAKYCHILNGSGKAEAVAIGASIMSYYSISDDLNKKFQINWEN